MPFIVVNGPPVKDIARKRAVVKGITDVIEKEYDMPRQSITVLIREDEETNVAQGGILLCEKIQEAK